MRVCGHAIVTSSAVPVDELELQGRYPVIRLRTNAHKTEGQFAVEVQTVQVADQCLERVSLTTPRKEACAEIVQERGML